MSGLKTVSAGISPGASQTLFTLRRVTWMRSTSSWRCPVMSEPSSSRVKAATRWPLATSALPSMASGHWRNCRVTPAVVTMVTLNSEEPQRDAHQRQPQRAKKLLVLRLDAAEQFERHQEHDAAHADHDYGHDADHVHIVGRR